MRHITILLSVPLIAGCAATGPVERGTKPLSAMTTPDTRTAWTPRTVTDPTAFTTQAPVRAHRARRFYLQGVKLLVEPPRSDEAIREFQLALEMDPMFYKAHFKLGICYYHKSQYDLEITEYKKCLAINRNYVWAWLNLGHAYLARDELEAARDAYEEVLGLSPDNRIALYNIGLVEFDLRLFDDSYKHLDRFQRVDGSGELGEKARQYLEEIRQRKTKGS